MACRASLIALAGALLAVPAAEAEGRVAWAVLSGYERYHAGCHVCHGADGVGSDFAPALVPVTDYDWFLEAVIGGIKREGAGGGGVMPAYGADPEVTCFLDDLYAYLAARTEGLAAGRPLDVGPKPAGYAARAAACLD